MTENAADTYTATKRSLHGLAELVLAGPRCRQGGSIELRVQAQGFRTRDEPMISMSGSALVTADLTVDVDGLTFAEAAARLGLEASRLDDIYPDGPKVSPDEAICLDSESVRQVERALALGDRALRSFHEGADPILWPEHFDVAVELGDATYGVSPGDRYDAQPYAYVSRSGPFTGEFWNAPFGAARLLAELDGVDGIVAFFRQGADAAGTRPT
ncbi:hypothetical protein GCM10027053_23850 [Intrasporangium mesophilum]